MEKEIIDNEETVIFSDLQEGCQDCILQSCANGYVNKICKKDNLTKRIAHVTNRNGQILICSSDCKNRRQFLSEMQSLVFGQKYFSIVKKQIVKETLEDEKNRVTRLEHNLKMLNGQCLQLLDSIVPQHLFLKNINANEVVSTVERIIDSNVRKTAVTSLKLAKHLMSVKSELFVYDVVLKDNVPLQKENHKVRDVLMLVLYKFFAELYEIGVFVEVDTYYELGYFDFDTVNVALYYIVENISKYVCPNTKIKVHLNKANNSNALSFEMRSLHVYKDEEGKIFHKGYSGKCAKQISMSGEGLGMYQAKRLLEMNDAIIDFVAGEDVFEINNQAYSDNVINIQIPLSKE